ncbi:MAG TPA: flagellar basal-body MS-ring/collar protein FliF [Methylococcaceae bacterium]|nr:flagellar basal-body MS-ring/collar protein FliF [Methylococcaceae bacterium]
MMELGNTEIESGGKSLVAGERSPATNGQKLPPIVRGFVQLPRGRQLGFIVALALAFAIGVAVLLWSQKPEYEQLFMNIPEKDAGEIVEALKKLNAEYELDRATGAIRVPADQLHELRLKLASQGLPREAGMGFEILDKEPGFGTSQMMEAARHQRALEGEIARSIMTIRSIKSARVHLALPKESVFVRQAKKSSASVVVDLHSGYGLEPGQVEAIVHLVASSVPQLEPGQVTVVDQRGHLLNSRENANEIYMTSKQFDYKKQVEEHLIERIENILSPVVGRDGLRTQVTADIDFTVTERTQELFNPDLPALRSEQTTEEQSRQGAAAQGVPGALSNQPPPAGVAPELASGQKNPQAGAQPGQSPQQGQEPMNASKSATRNYELDKTISHSRLGTGDVRRLSVAVVVDNQRVTQPDGSVVMQPFSDEDLTRFSNLVKEAVGFDVTRGDRVTVTNAAFRTEDALPAVPWWEQAWVWPLFKQVCAGLVIILLILGVLRPAVKGLTKRGEAEIAAAQAAAGGGEGGRASNAVTAGAAGVQSNQELLTLGSNGEDLLLLEAPQSYEKRLEYAQRAIDQDPKRVAQLVKTWMSNNG